MHSESSYLLVCPLIILFLQTAVNQPYAVTDKFCKLDSQNFPQIWRKIYSILLLLILLICKVIFHVHSQLITSSLIHSLHMKVNKEVKLQNKKISSTIFHTQTIFCLLLLEEYSCLSCDQRCWINAKFCFLFCRYIETVLPAGHKAVFCLAPALLVASTFCP